MLTTNYNAFESIPAGSTSRRLYIDAEPMGDNWAVVARGEDYQVIGRTITKKLPALIHNELDGSYVRYVLTTGERLDVERAADALLHLYRDSDTIGVRLAKLPADLATLAAVLMAAFPVEFFSRPDGGAPCRTGQFCDTLAARRAQLKTA